MSPFTSSFRKLINSVLYAALLCSGLFGAATLQAQNCTVNPRIKKIPANISATIKSYMEYKPVDYASNPTKKYALLVYFGGTGEMFQQPNTNAQELCNLLQYSMPHRMNTGQFPDEVTDSTGKKYSYLVVMPFVTSWDQQYQIDPGSVIDYMLQAYPNRIDVNRVYLTGMSRGTDNIMGYVTSSTAASSKVAAIAPVANCFPDHTGSGNLQLFNQQVSNLAGGNLRMWGISCANDKVCTENYMKNWVSSLNVLKPGSALFTYSSMDCEGPDSSFHYAWNHAYNPNYRLAPGNKNIYEWLIQFSKGSSGGGGGGPTEPPAPSCSTISVSASTASIKIKGLIAPVATVHIFNSSWATVYNQSFSNSPDSITVSNLPAGTYHVKVNFYTSSWSPICEKMQDATVGTTGGGGGGGGDNGGGGGGGGGTPTNNCTNIAMSPASGSIKFTGLISPVVAVHIFNNSWATVYNRTFTNSPNNLTVPLPVGTYHVKVTFYTSGWSYVCDKMQDVVITTAAGAAPEITSSSTANEQANVFTIDPVARRLTVAPNPFAGALQVVVGSNKSENGTIVIMDLAGREVYRQSVSLQKGVNRFSIDGSRYRAGSYMLRLVTSEGIENMRLIRQ